VHSGVTAEKVHAIGWSAPVSGPELHPLASSAFHGALFRQLTLWHGGADRIASLLMATRFIKINEGWNAEPNAPAPVVSRSGDDVILEFDLNAFRYKNFAEGDRGRLVFRHCWRYRLGSRRTKGGIWASVDSATLPRLGESFMKSMAISSWNPCLTIG
jgi:hypothetical protein